MMVGGESQDVPKPEPRYEIHDVSDGDVVIVGAGVGGMISAMLLSKISDKKIVVLEGQKTVGGIFSTEYTSPCFFYPTSRDDLQDLDALIKDKALVDQFYSDISIAIELLEDYGFIKNKYATGFRMYTSNLDRCNTYHQNAGNPVENRLVAWSNRWIHGKGWFKHMSKNVRMKHFYNFVRESWKKKLYELQNVTVHTNTMVDSIDMEASRVITQSGKKYKYSHLVLACGGFGSNTELLSETYNNVLQSHKLNEINNGLSCRLAQQCGFKYNKELMAWRCETTSHNNSLLFLQGPSVIVVNGDGQRVYNEKLVYSNRAQHKYNELLVITDTANLKRFSQTRFCPPSMCVYLPHPSQGAYTKGRSVEDLCENLRMEESFTMNNGFESNLVKQVALYHKFVETGIDLQFQRGTQAGEYRDGPELSKYKNNSLHPLNTSKLVAMALYPSSLDTSSGPCVDEYSRVLRESDGQPVPNIFAIGNCSASIVQGHYIAPGIPISSCMVGAYRMCKLVVGENTTKSSSSSSMFSRASSTDCS
jgi:hypothetical protein